MNDHQIPLGEHTLLFTVPAQEWRALLGGLAQTDTFVFEAHNILLDAVCKEQKERLGEVFEADPSVVMELFGAIQAQKAEAREAILKKPWPSMNAEKTAQKNG